MDSKFRDWSLLSYLHRKLYKHYGWKTCFIRWISDNLSYVWRNLQNLAWGIPSLSLWKRNHASYLLGNILNGKCRGYELGYKKNEIPEVKETYAFLNTAYPCLNEKQLAIGETTLRGKEELSNQEGLFPWMTDHSWHKGSLAAGDLRLRKRKTLCNMVRFQNTWWSCRCLGQYLQNFHYRFWKSWYVHV